MEIARKDKQELFSLVEYCKIFNYDTSEFEPEESPDWQSKKLDIGIECTSALPKDNTCQSGEDKTISKALKYKTFAEYKNFTNEWKRKSEERDEAIKNGQIEKAEKLIKKLDEENPVFAYPTSAATDPVMLLDVVLTKIKKLNGHYTRFNTNALFMRVSSNFAGANYFSMCGINSCNVSECKKSDNCNNCGKIDKYNGCMEDDCKEHKICTVGRFIKVLQNTSYAGDYKFNPIVLSQIGDSCENFCCWVINTDNYSVVEHQGSRTLSKDKFNEILTKIENARMNK